jgi:hypothetical protein
MRRVSDGWYVVDLGDGCGWIELRRKGCDYAITLQVVPEQGTVPLVSRVPAPVKH